MELMDGRREKDEDRKKLPRRILVARQKCVFAVHFGILFCRDNNHITELLKGYFASTCQLSISGTKCNRRRGSLSKQNPITAQRGIFRSASLKDGSSAERAADL